MRPFGLRKFEPVTWTDSPAAPLEGLSVEITGAAPGAAGTAALVVVLFGDEDAPAGPPPLAVDGWCAFGEPPVWLGVVTVEDVADAGGELLRLASDTARPMAAAAISTATTAMAAMSQRSGWRTLAGLGGGEGGRVGGSGGRS
jgi:hypothetical protein